MESSSQPREILGWWSSVSRVIMYLWQQTIAQNKFVCINQNSCFTRNGNDFVQVNNRHFVHNVNPLNSRLVRHSLVNEPLSKVAALHLSTTVIKNVLADRACVCTSIICLCIRNTSLCARRRKSIAFSMCIFWSCAWACAFLSWRSFATAVQSFQGSTN